MEKFLLIVSILFGLIAYQALGQNSSNFTCGNPSVNAFGSSSQIQSISSSRLSSNGYVFTPKGKIRALVVFAGFQSGPFRKQPIVGWDTSTNALPTIVNPTTGKMDKLFFDNYNTFQNIPTGNQSISRWYYDMSQGQFELIAEVLKDPSNGLPVRIDVPARYSYSGANNYDVGAMHRQVLDTIKRRYNNSFNWSRFDTITNNPSYGFRSDSSNADRNIDFIIIVSRISSSVFTDPQTNITGTVAFSGNGHTGIEAGISNIRGNDGLNYNILSSSGFTYNTGADFSGNLIADPNFSPLNAISSTIHEFGHMIIGAPHVCLCNGAISNRLNMHNGVSMMNLRDSPIGTCNAFESWYMGWSHLTTYNSISSFQTSRTYHLKDFMASRDSSFLRIKIPGAGRSQYLWLENHSVSHPFHNRLCYSKDGYGNILPNTQLGLFAFIQDQPTIDTLTKCSDAYDDNNVNGVRFLHSLGNNEYVPIDSGISRSDVWGNRVFTCRKNASDPFSETSKTTRLRVDFESKFGLYNQFGVNSPNVIYQNSNFNSSSSEMISFWKENGGSSFDFIGVDMAFGRGANFEKIGISENSAILNSKNFVGSHVQYQDVISSEKLEPTILNGISVRILNKYGDGSIDVEVKTNDTDIDKNQRFTGEIQLTNIEGANNDLNIKSGVTITLNKSGNPNRRFKRNSGSFNKGNFPDFIFPSSLSCKSGSVLNMERQSIFYVTDSSALVLESGSTLNVGSNAFLGILNGSILKIKSGATLSIADSGIVEIKPGSQICIEAGAIINLHNKGIIALRPGFYTGISSANAFMIESTSCKPLLALVLGDISISCICKPSNLQSGASNPRLSAKVAGMHPRYLWKVISGTATLSDSTASSPFVNSVTSDSVTFRLTVTDSLNNYSIRDFKVKFTTEQRPIYLMRDGWDDNGVEAYPGYVYNSEDLAVTTDSALVSSDSLPLHQNAQRKGSVRNASTANWLYARVRNVGCKSGPSSSTGDQLHFYWTKASLGEMWSRDWLLNNDILAPYQISGEEITNVYDTASSSYINSVISVSNIAPGSAKVYGHRWFPPRPQNYAGGAAITEICVLARITDGSSGNGSMLPAANQSGAYEQDNVEVSQNVRNFRAIATKNLFVYNDNPVNEFIHNSNGGVEVSQSYIRWGGTGTAENQVLTIEAPTPTNGSSFNPMDWRKIYRLKIILGQTLYNKMSASLSGNTDVQLLPSDYGFEVIGSGFHSASVYLSKTELYPLKVVFVRKINSDVVSPIDFMFRISAYASSDNKLLGSQQYNIKASPFVSGKPNEDALRFDGTNDFVLTATLPEYSFDGTDFSLGAMVKITEKNQNWNHRILTVGKQGFNGFAWGIDENEDHSFTPYLTIGTAKVKADVTANADGDCHYTAVVKRSDRIEFYWDGKLLSVISGSINGISIPTNEPTLIGGVLPETEENAFFYGNLDNVCIWQRSLSPSEIKNYQFNGVSVDEIANLISYWDFDEESQVFTDQNVLDHYATLGTSVAVETYDPTYLESCSDEALKDSYNQGASSGLEGSSQTGTVTRGLLVSPNPSESVYTVTLTDLAALGTGGNGTVNFSVVSMSGNTLLQVTNQNLSTYTFQFQLNAAVGIYRLNVQSGTNVYNALLIKR